VLRHTIMHPTGKADPSTPAQVRASVARLAGLPPGRSPAFEGRIDHLARSQDVAAHVAFGYQGAYDGFQSEDITWR
jgi:hypothetical protein